MSNFWSNMGRGARVGFGIGVTLIAVLSICAACWLLRVDYRVLFADLTAQDASAMAAELDRMKVPYRLGDDGVSILVEADAVHRTRLKLMAKDLPLHGTVGFELFNNADFGMTEFAQKINYQRALQGEITRTILSLSEIDTARVHLALPEESLFKRADSKAKASITLAVKRGQALRGEQITGIQRLVSAAVPAIQAQDVTIVDQHGVALTRPALADGDSGGSDRLDSKKQTESYLAAKALAVLERTFGVGQASVSVDVSLDMDAVKTTTEEVVGAGAQGGQAVGVLVRERSTFRDAGAAPGAHSGDTQKEVDYQVGRRVRQTVSAPGAVARIHVVAVVRKSLDLDQADQVRALVLASVGGVASRGDTVVLQSSDGIAPPLAPRAVDADSTTPVAVAPALPATPVAGAIGVLPLLLVLLAACIGAGLALVRRRVAPPRLSEAQRIAALDQVNAWLQRPAVSPERLRSGS